MANSIQLLSIIILFTALMWVPYILNSFVVRGIFETMGYADDLPPLSPWAARTKKAHANAVENLVLFAPLVLIHAAAGETGGGVATGSAVYLGARVAHYAAYAARIPVARTLAFLVGWAATVYLAYLLI